MSTIFWNSARYLSEMVRQEFYDADIRKEFADVAVDENQIEVIVTVGLLYQLELAVEVGRLALHEQHLLFGQSLDAPGLGRLDEFGSVECAASSDFA